MNILINNGAVLNEKACFFLFVFFGSVLMLYHSRDALKNISQKKQITADLQMTREHVCLHMFASVIKKERSRLVFAEKIVQN